MAQLSTAELDSNRIIEGQLDQRAGVLEEAANADVLSYLGPLAYLVQNFDSAELYQYEQERELSIALLEEWLVKYKFKNWKLTEQSKTKVTPTMRKARANAIATKLNDTKLWHSHSRGIPMVRLQRDLNLLIDDFEANSELAKPIYDYFRLLQDYQGRRSHYVYVIHGKGRHVGVGF
jgi:hypothetical protein